MSSPFHPALRGLYAGSAAQQRVVEALRQPGELWERLTQPVDGLPLFQEEALLAGLFRSFGLDGILGPSLNRVEAQSSAAANVTVIQRASSSIGEDRIEPPLGIDFSPTVRTGATHLASGKGKLREEPATSTATERFDAVAPPPAGAPGVVSVSEGREAIPAKWTPDELAGSPNPAAGRWNLDTAGQPPVTSRSRAAMSAPPFGRDADSNESPLNSEAEDSAANATVAAPRDSAILPAMWSDAEAAQRGRHQPVLIRESPAVDLRARRQPDPASASAASWSGQLADSLAKLETSRANGAAERSQPEPELLGNPGTGLRRLATLGRASVPRPREVPTSDSAPSVPTADLRHELAGILRREALRHGISPEEWDQ